MRPRYDRAVHSVAILPETPLTAFLDGAELGVTATTTRQSKRLPPGLVEMARSEDGLVEAVYMPEAFCVGGAVVSGVFLPHRCEQPEDLLRICCSGLCIKGLTKYRSIMVWPEFPTSDIQPLQERLAGCLSKAWV